MGSDLLDIPEVSEVFVTMSKILGIDLIDLAKNGTADEIDDTETAQALTMAVSVGIGKALKARGLSPDAIIGFSLGQISALVLADILTLEEASWLLKVRSGSMAKACAEQPGGMVALMGATLDEAQALCTENAEGDVLVCANHNAPGQIVISGHNAALDRAQERWKEAGKRSVRLATAGAFHSPLMASAAREVESFCESITFKEPSVTLICNTDAKPFVVEEASKRLGKHVESGVMFEQSVRALIDDGETDFVEVGFDKEASRVCLGTREAFDEYVA